MHNARNCWNWTQELTVSLWVTIWDIWSWSDQLLIADWYEKIKLQFYKRQLGSDSKWLSVFQIVSWWWDNYFLLFLNILSSYIANQLGQSFEPGFGNIVKLADVFEAEWFGNKSRVSYEKVLRDKFLCYKK